MKLAFYFVCLFFLSFALKSESRELSRLEKSASTFMKRNLETLNELVRLTNVSDMSIPDYLSYQVLKKSCDPGVALLEQISKSQDLLDQSERYMMWY